ncbi:MAG: hypothetical protein M1825_001016 [Sarcosagium campestre]|nr:MAG: hypothetical protein M1825_001016 [Sarcosagium campestre]
MVPRFARTQKFANPYASAAIDALFAILWFSAFVAVATWNSAGEKAGEEEHKKDKDPPKGCAAFGFGSKTRCNVSKGTVAIGALIFVLFILTSAMSVKVAFQFRKNGSLPGVSSDFTAVNAQTQDAFSSNHDDDELSYESAPHPPAHSRQDDEYGLLHSAERPSGAAHQHNSSEGHEIAPPYNEHYDDHYYQEPLPSAEMRDNRPEDRRYGGNSGPSGHVPFPEADYEYRGAAPR